MKREMVVCEVTVRKITRKQESWYLKSDIQSSMKRCHIQPDDGIESIACFPTLKLSMKEGLDLLWISHYKKDCSLTGLVVCIITLKDGSTWKAPSHKVGKCPFCDCH